MNFTSKYFSNAKNRNIRKRFVRNYIVALTSNYIEDSDRLFLRVTAERVKAGTKRDEEKEISILLGLFERDGSFRSVTAASW